MDEKKLYNIVIANSFKQIRLLNGLKQKEVANEIGIKTRCYCYYENSKREIPVYILIKLSQYYKTTIDYIVNFKG